jgi:prefoldin alpha subunit
MDEKEKKMYHFQMLQQNLDQIKQQTALIVKTYEEIEMSKRALEDVKTLKRSEAMIPIGAGNFLRGTIENVDKILVSAGSSMMLEKTPDEALKLTNERIEEVKTALNGLAQQEQLIQMELAKLQPEIQQMLAGKQ